VRAPGTGARIVILSPAKTGSRSGNSVTAQRYSRMLRSLGHQVRALSSESDPPDADLLIALHARKSARAVLAFSRAHPMRPVAIVLTGTDVYPDVTRSRAAVRALDLADAIVTLQPLAIERLPLRLRGKARVIWQSVDAARRPELEGHRRRRSTRFVVLGHLRREKDPLRAAYALRLLPPSTDAEVLQAGGVLDRAYVASLERAQTIGTRYRYLGELSRSRALALLAESDALVLSSRREGGANVASEAIALGIPVLASRIDGNAGIFGAGYAGYYRVASTRELAALMHRFVADDRFRQRLRRQIVALRPLVAPDRERRALRRLVNDLLK
jgi:putative glycosyltransferase (TIGR04348 family)